MSVRCRILFLFCLLLCQNQHSLCDDFQENVNDFMDAFDEAYPTEVIKTFAEELSEGNEVPAEVFSETSKSNEELVEEEIVTDKVFLLGDDVRHDLTEEVQTLAERLLSSISPELQLINVTDAVSTVTDKVQRTLSLVVTRQNCGEEEVCEVACRVELVSSDEGDNITWHNCLDSPNGNDVMRAKRGAIGGFKQVDDEEAKELAEVAIQTLDSIDADDTKRVVTQVIRAQKQLVNGIMYHLTLEVASSDCKEDGDSDKCDGKLSDRHICKILMQRHFSGEAPHNAQVIKSECTPISKSKVIEDKKRAKRQADSVETNFIGDEKPPKDKPHHHNKMMGGITRQDPNSEKIIELSQFAVSEIDKTTNSVNKQKVVRVVDARSQIVSGVKYFLKLELVETDCRKGSNQEVCNPVDKPLQSCDVVIFEKPWKKLRVISRVTCGLAQSRKKRGIPGGLSKADPNDPKVQEIAQFALAQLDAKSNSMNQQKLILVKEAKTQIVAGANYYLTLQLVETNCRKGSPVNSACDAAPGKVLQECEVVVYDRPWDKHREMTSDKCSAVSDAKKVNKRGIPGGLSPANPNDPEVQEMARFALTQLDAKSNSMNQQKLILVKKAETQVVAGTNYYLTLQLVETNCRKGSPVSSSCDTAPGKTIQECEVVVYDRPWDKHREMTSAKCSALASKQARRKRALVGGRKDADPSSPQVQQMAQFALSQLDERSNSLNQQRLVQVTKAQTQVVAGTNYYLTLQLEETNCRKGSPANSKCNAVPGKALQICDVVVYDRPWDHHREMTSANCSEALDSKKIRKRSPDGIVIGGHQAQEKDSKEIQELAQFAVEDLNKKSNSLYKHVLTEVLSATSQVVSGISYHIKLRIAESNCKKNSALNPANCDAKSEAVPQECEVTIWSRPWLKERQVTKSNCQQVQEQKQNIAEAKAVDPLSPEVLEAARSSLKAIDRGSNSMYKHALIRVVDSKVQTVSGKKYFLTVEVGESECTKRQSDENCNLRTENSLNEKCKVVVWDRPWLKKKEVLDVQCGLRSKRSIVTKPKSQKELDLESFELFKQTHSKTYNDEVEHRRRFRIFRANLKKIQALQENEQGTATYGPTMFADLSEKEFRQKYLGLKRGQAPKSSSHHMVPAQIPNVDLPTDFDWRDHDAVTPVKNQGQCGSCWAFSVTGNIEGQVAVKHGKLISLSEQELVDCDKSDSGCNGGYMTVAYEAIEKLGGLELEDQYPYDAEVETCKFNKSVVQATVTGSLNITSNETDMARWLVANGPISIGINANAMQFYMGGVSHPFKFLCNKNDLDHGVLLVGFGVHNYPLFHKSLPFWIIKNSWGPKWGEQGYYRVYRGDGTCGVNQMASSAIVG